MSLSMTKITGEEDLFGIWVRGDTPNKEYGGTVNFTRVNDSDPVTSSADSYNQLFWDYLRGVCTSLLLWNRLAQL